MEIRNRTPLMAAWSVLLDKEAAEHLGVAVRGTWDIDARGGLRLVAEEPPFQPVDACAGEQGLSSVRYEADTGYVKPSTDCALVGSAVAPRGRATQVTVSFRVATVSKQALVTGERKRLFWLLRWWNSPARGFKRVPLQWELAAGGTDTTPKNEKQHSLDMRNPYGRGFRARGSKLPQAGAPLPQILTPGFRLFGRKKVQVGFGLTGSQWAHRLPFAGTYDAAWMENKAPLLPDDFDDRFHLAAAPGLSTPKYLMGGEQVEVRGCTPSGKLAFRLPRVTLDVNATLNAAAEPVDMRMVTVTVDSDAMQLRILWRGSIDVHRRLPKLKFIQVAAEGLQ